MSINVAVVACAQAAGLCVYARWVLLKQKARSADAKRFKPNQIPSLRVVRARWLIWFAMCV